MERHRAAVRDRLIRAGGRRADSAIVTRKVLREIVVVAGWGRAILLQFAHPLIAAGVADHSAFRGSLLASFRRLSSTIGAMLSLTFGTDDDAIDAAAGINLIHDRVNGRLHEPTGAVAAGERYSAHDQELLRWVHATLLESIPLVYERLVEPLTVEERDRYCAEAATMEPLLDIPDGLLPRSMAELDAYLADMHRSGRIAIGPASRALAHAVLYPPWWQLLWPMFRPIHLITIGLLPAAIREDYGFRWTARDDRALARWTAALRLLRRVMPPFVREWPVARRQPIAATLPPAQSILKPH